MRQSRTVYIGLNPHIFSVKAKIIVVFVIVTIGQKGLQFVYMIICNKNIMSMKPINNLLILFFSLSPITLVDMKISVSK